MSPETLKQLVLRATANEMALWVCAVNGAVPVTEVRKIVDNADVVFAVWQDDAEPARFGHRVVKGAHLLTDNDTIGRSHAVDAIKCLEEDDARALEAFCLKR